MEAALAAGVRAYVLKEDAGEELVVAIHSAVAGNRFIRRGYSAS